MKKLIGTGILLLGLLYSTVGNGATYYVSNSGNDSNPGTSASQPWKSLSKVNNLTPKAGDSILFKRGGAWVGTLTVSSSGATGNPITYGAYGTGEKPILYSSQRITGWTRHSGNIYKTNFNSSINQLFVDGERLRIARFPNSGYAFINSVQSSTTFSSNDLNGSVNYSGAGWIGRTRVWSYEAKTVTSSNSTTLTLNAPAHYQVDKDEGFILLDKMEFLDSPGEWYHNKSTKTLYVWLPDGSSPSNHEIRGSVFQHGVILENKSHITLRDFAIKHSSDNGISGANCKYVTIENNDIMFPDKVGIIIKNGTSENNTISNNKVRGANHYGIRIYGQHYLVSDNEILEICKFENFSRSATGNIIGGRAIDLRGANNIIRYNRIIDTGNTGIGAYKAPNSIIEYNFIKDITQYLGDAGAIHLWDEDI